MKLEADPMTYIVNARRKTVGLSNFGFFAISESEGTEMRVSEKRAKEIDAFYRQVAGEEYADAMSNIASDYSKDLAADLVEARNTLKDIGRISAPCDTLGDAVFVVKKIDKIYAITTAYFTKED